MESGTCILGWTARGDVVEVYGVPGRAAGVWVDELAALPPRLDAAFAAALWAVAREPARPTQEA